MSRPLVAPRDTNNAAAAYDEDYFAWTQDQIAALRAGRIHDLDLANLAEEIGDLGMSAKREIRSRLLVLLNHLLKWKYQPDRRSNSWKASIIEQRNSIVGEIESSPSLRPYPATVLVKQYDIARLAASGETGLDLATFPGSCPFSITEILDPAFYPEAQE